MHPGFSQRRINNNLDDEQNNVVFIKLETCPRPEKRKIEFWWLLSTHLGMRTDYSMQMALSHVAEAHGI